MGLISKTISPSPPPLSIMKVTVLKQSTYLKMTLDGVLTTSTFLGVQAQVTMSGSCDGGDGALVPARQALYQWSAIPNLYSYFINEVSWITQQYTVYSFHWY